MAPATLAQASGQSERRRETRKSAFVSCKILSGGFSKSVIDGIIRNFSEHGIRVVADGLYSLPTDVMIELNDGSRRFAIRRWVRFDEAAFEFASPLS